MRLATGSEAEAEACYERALRIAKAQKARLWQIKAATSIAKLRLARGQPHLAHPVLAAALDRQADDSGIPSIVRAHETLGEIASHIDLTGSGVSLVQHDDSRR
jgi:hypothetical protein